MIDQDFCAFLEYELTKALSNTSEATLKGFWCDGILHSTSDNDAMMKTINDTRTLTLTAYIGKDGQDSYDLLLKFGNRSLSRLARNLEINSCIPTTEQNWYIINVAKKTITVQML